MTTPLPVTPASVSDAPALAAVFVRCWQTAYRGIVADDIIDGLNRFELERRWARFIEEQGVFVVRVDGTAVGMTRIGADPDDPDRGHLFSLYVDPSKSGAGLGRALLARATAELAAAGYRTATLWVFADNERALRFYRAAGWSETGGHRVEPEWRAPELQLATQLT